MIIDDSRERELKLQNKTQQIIKLKNTVDKFQVSLENQKTEPSNESQIDVINLMVKVKNKVKILEDRAFYTDSLYFEIVKMTLIIVVLLPQYSYMFYT